MVGLGRLELPTSRLSGVRSSHLSYRPSVVSLVLSTIQRSPPDGVGLSKPGSEVRRAARRLGFDGFLFSVASRLATGAFFLRKEVIQPLLPERLPCYDFTPITTHTLVRCLPCGLAHALLVQATLMV